jgi:hypothetical protein
VTLPDGLLEGKSADSASVPDDLPGLRNVGSDIDKSFSLL